MNRTQISLEETDRRLLDAEAARTGKSMSSLVRDAVRIAYGPKDDLSADIARIRAAHGGWSAEGEAGEQYVDHLRTGERWRQLDR